ncbi:MAG: adenosylcobinamide-GDP ribazoletransferase [Lachnospiraceae bacterium]|nr:adenosylcobinamide-GDP ribazoletransferase [Lachnospiraceae bacterium]
MFRWMNSRENAKYRICFRPFYGAATGIVLCLLNLLCQRFDLGQSCFALIGAAVPVLMSGGIYLSGFMNTSETLAERLSGAAEQKAAGPDRKSDAAGTSAGAGTGRMAGYAGTYGVIAAAAFFLLYAGGLSTIRKDSQIVLLGIGYMISRALYGMAFVWFPAAGAEKGEFSNFSPRIKRALRIILSVILALCFCTCVMIEPIMGMLEALLCMWIWTYYYYMSKKVFGGVTKESAGYFLILCELAAVLFVGLFGKAFL